MICVMNTTIIGLPGSIQNAVPAAPPHANSPGVLAICAEKISCLH
jgi:hypothetical protein